MARPPLQGLAPINGGVAQVPCKSLRASQVAALVKFQQIILGKACAIEVVVIVSCEVGNPIRTVMHSLIVGRSWIAITCIHHTHDGLMPDMVMYTPHMNAQAQGSFRAANSISLGMQDSPPKGQSPKKTFEEHRKKHEPHIFHPTCAFSHLPCVACTQPNSL